MTTTSRYEWRTLDFRSATGWRTVHLKPATGLQTYPMPGWLIQEEVGYDIWNNPILDDTWVRRVVPGIMEDSEILPAVDMPDFWGVLTDSEPPPLPDLEVKERERRRTAAEYVQRAADEARELVS